MNDILDSLGEHVCTVDNEFRTTFLTRAAGNIVRERREEAIGRF